MRGNGEVVNGAFRDEEKWIKKIKMVCFLVAIVDSLMQKVSRKVKKESVSKWIN